MQYVNFGTTGLQISRLGFGGIPIQRIDQPGTRELLIAAHKAGINYIDTARAYTVSEAWIGQSLEEAGLRDDFILATKCRALTKADMEAEIATSLKNLRTDHIELVQFHNPSLDGLKTILAPGGAMEALLEAKARGIVGHIGITAHLAAVFEAALDIPEIETIMFPYNIVETQGEALMRRCTEQNVGFIVMKPLAGGALEDATLALRFIRQNPDVSVVIPGMYSVDEVRQNLAAMEDASPLTAQELERIDAIRKELGTQFCRRCNYCQPCTAGIGISGIFVLEGYLQRYGLGDWAKARYAGMEKKAGDCIGCGACEARCPYQLPIREMLARCKAEFGA